MDLTLKRTEYTPDGVFGVLLDSSGNQIAVTLEHSYNNTAKIPVGEYTCVRSMHRLHGMTVDFETFEITNVPGHTNILFHWGNYNKDSEGCVLVGKDKAGAMINHSRDTFKKLMEIESDAPRFKLTVV